MIPLSTAVALLLLGALVAMLGSTWAELSTSDRLTAAGLMFAAILVLLNVDPITRRFRGDK